jgi:2-aminoethylphosphonate dioxygenase
MVIAGIRFEDALSSEYQGRYHRDGFVKLRAVFSPAEVSELQQEADRLFQRTDLVDSDNIRCRWQNHVEAGECRFDCFDPVIDLSPTMEKLARDSRIIGAVSALYGEQACLFKDKLILKPPNAVGYGLHQDYVSWDSFPESFMTVIAAIDPADAGNGAPEVFPGYHQRGCMSTKDGMYQGSEPVRRGNTRSRSGRHRDFQRIHSASVRAQPLGAMAAPGLSEFSRAG